MSRKPITPEIERDVATSIHLLVLAGLAVNPKWRIDNIVFQGGTSISFAWRSPRFSEDLDFVVARGFDISAEMEQVKERVAEGMLTRHPGCQIGMRDRTKEGDRMSVFHIHAELPETIGKIKVKAEFWKAEPKAIAEYGRDSIYLPLGRAEISPVFSVATPERLMMDKLNAIAHREYLKWRDLFDIWYLENNFHSRVEARFDNPEGFAAQMQISSALYGREAAEAIPGLLEFLERDDAEILKSAERDLKPWLPRELWEKFWPDTVARMLAASKKSAKRATDLLSKSIAKTEKSGEKRAPRGVNIR
ncbi:MAG: nucleotidyl transferase AbiEii/AbiGii toxin family protein [Azospirillum sp.]|nr:nucleotidyl transferase AbiEii/AbiGii toxin family protein [Azospirillum sp.]